jgi:hypothetical protein
VLLAVAASAMSAQGAASQALTGYTWSQKLQDFANLTRLLELTAFVFSAYQFWKGRRERNAADVTAAEQARIDANYQAWQVINSAQGKGGSGGRLEALRDLLRNGESLAGVNLDDAWLEGVQLPRAMLVQGSLQRTNLNHANLAGANLERADFGGAELVAANLSGAYLRGANFTNARLSAAILDGADLTEVVGWNEVRSLGHASIAGVRNAPAGFREFSIGMGAVESELASPRNADGDRYSQMFRAL